MLKINDVEFDGHKFVFAVDHKYKLWVKVDSNYPELSETFKSPKKETYVSSSMLALLYLYGVDVKCKHEISHLIHFVNCCQMKLYVGIADVFCQMKLYAGIADIINKGENIDKDIIIDILKNIDVSKALKSKRFDYSVYDNYTPYSDEVDNPFMKWIIGSKSTNMRLSVEKTRFIIDDTFVNDYVTDAYVDNIIDNIYHTTMGYSYKYSPSVYKEYESEKRILVEDSPTKTSTNNVFSHMMPRKLHNAIKNKNVKEVSFEDLCKNYIYTNKHYVCIYDDNEKQYVYLNPYAFPMDHQYIYYAALIAVDRYGEKLTTDDIVFVPRQEPDTKELVFVSTDFITKYIHPLQYADKEKAFFLNCAKEDPENAFIKSTIFFNDMRNPDVSGVALSVEATKVFFKACLKHNFFKVKPEYQSSLKDYEPSLLDIRNSIRNYGYSLNIDDGRTMFDIFHKDLFFHYLKEVITDDPELKYLKTGKKVKGIVRKQDVLNIIQECDELPEALIPLLKK